MSGPHPYLSYREPATAITWMTALGGEVVHRIEDPDGGFLCAEVRLGDALLVVAAFEEDYEAPRLRRRSVGYGLYLATDDVDAAYEQALDAGSRPVVVPESSAWGRRARVLDPGGYEWTFGDYRPGSTPDDAENPAIPSR